ncbi:C-type lectin domain family 10 member A-like [Carassius gibelio]|uniref:C-type lectin domain family 10 member A-like n=1 Tax=Carassius gibelio TaxID=101364 RepID=UPI002279E12A|nr:C-type lectin domain family 10 member A-like [Carassius gibelio]
MSGRVNDSMDKGSIMDSEDRIERIVDIYVSAETVRDMKHKKETEDFNTEEPQTPRHTEDFNTEEPRTPRHTGSDGVMIRSSRAAAVVFVLLCVLLLTARIILCATFTQERQQLLTKITNLTQERDQLKTKITNLTQERQQLLTNNMSLTQERDQLKTKITNLTQERQQLLTNNMNLTQERQQLKTKIINLTEERDKLKSERNDLKFADGLKCHQSSLYFFSSETKNWDESRRYCRERGTDLIIINNREEHDFVKNICGSDHFWIGLTDVEVEGRWKWVDGSTLTSGSWAPKEPNNYQGNEDCANTYSSGWLDTKCDSSVKWICEKSILK